MDDVLRDSSLGGEGDLIALWQCRQSPYTPLVLLNTPLQLCYTPLQLRYDPLPGRWKKNPQVLDTRTSTQVRTFQSLWQHTTDATAMNAARVQ